MADLIFALVFHAVQKQVHSELLARGMLPMLVLKPGPFAPPDLATDLTVALPPPAFHDDLVIPLEAATPEGLVQAVAEAAAIMTEAAAAFGMKVNLAEGNTEAIYAFAGKGSRAAKQSITRHMVQSASGTRVATVPLRTGGHRKWLGCGESCRGRIDAEV